jgi:hypothetical protein
MTEPVVDQRLEDLNPLPGDHRAPSRRISSSDLPENMPPVMISIHPPRYEST